MVGGILGQIIFYVLLSQAHIPGEVSVTIMGALIPTAIFSAFFSFWICADFSMTYLCRTTFHIEIILVILLTNLQRTVLSLQ